MYDRSETARRGYVDPRTRVRFDGTEVLGPKDWKKRKMELWERCGGICEWGKGLVRCRNHADDPHHIVKRSERRIDNLSNLQAICRYHHNLLDPRKPRWSGSHDAANAEVVPK